MIGNLLHYYMGIGKNGSSKRSRNLAGFSRFSKKTGKNRNQSWEIGSSQDVFYRPAYQSRL